MLLYDVTFKLHILLYYEKHYAFVVDTGAWTIHWGAQENTWCHFWICKSQVIFSNHLLLSTSIYSDWYYDISFFFDLCFVYNFLIWMFVLCLTPASDHFCQFRYTDSTKTAFKSSTRLECMMQDYPKTLPPSAKVGFTVRGSWSSI